MSRNIEELRNYFFGKNPDLKETLADNSLRLIGIPGADFALKKEIVALKNEINTRLESDEADIDELQILANNLRGDLNMLQRYAQLNIEALFHRVDDLDNAMPDKENVSNKTSHYADTIPNPETTYPAISAMRQYVEGREVIKKPKDTRLFLYDGTEPEYGLTKTEIIYVGTLYLNGTVDTNFNHSLVCCYTAENNATYYSIMASNNMLQHGYQFYRIKYSRPSNTWSVVDDALQVKVDEEITENSTKQDIPTSNKVYDLVASVGTSLQEQLDGKQDISLKQSVLADEYESDEYYPSSKAVVEYVRNNAGITTLGSIHLHDGETFPLATGYYSTSSFRVNDDYGMSGTTMLIHVDATRHIFEIFTYADDVYAQVADKVTYDTRTKKYSVSLRKRYVAKEDLPQGALMHYVGKADTLADLDTKTVVRTEHAYQRDGAEAPIFEHWAYETEEAEYLFQNMTHIEIIELGIIYDFVKGQSRGTIQLDANTTMECDGDSIHFYSSPNSNSELTLTISIKEHSEDVPHDVGETYYIIDEDTNYYWNGEEWVMLGVSKSYVDAKLGLVETSLQDLNSGSGV